MIKLSKKENKKKNDEKINLTPSVTPVPELPIDSVDMVNTFGTYNIQPTNDTDNDFPKISQGMPEKEKEKRG